MITKRIGEDFRVDCEALAVTSGVGATSEYYSMEGYDRALIVVGGATLAANLQGVISITQAANATATPGAITASSAVIGSSAATRVDNARCALISITTATTDGNTIIINGTTFTVSTANAATSLQFGSTDGSTGGTGVAQAVGALSSLINTYCTNLSASSASTATVRVWVKDKASTTINIVTTGGGISAAYLKFQSAIELKASILDSTSRGFRVNISTMGTAVAAGFTVIREGAYKPAALQGPYLLATRVGT